MDVTPEKGASVPPTRPGTMLQRNGDEIVVCGQMFHTGTRVVTWLEHNGYNAYSCTNTVVQTASPPPPPALRYGTRKVRAKKGIVYPSSRLSLDRDDPSSRSNPFAAHNWEEVRPSYWDIINLQQAVHQVVIHYDGCGTARRCFKVLHDERTLSCHFIIDIDGTVYAPQSPHAPGRSSLAGRCPWGSDKRARVRAATRLWTCGSALGMPPWQTTAQSGSRYVKVHPPILLPLPRAP
mmetsp:Transcript_5187/g.17138  ORF Transcript_5187/g.17138 Transcript_5187/m.17138 type:complete len:236 (+) Transcript_5187:186-893(+)